METTDFYLSGDNISLAMFRSCSVVGSLRECTHNYTLLKIVVKPPVIKFENDKIEKTDLFLIGPAPQRDDLTHTEYPFYVYVLLPLKDTQDKTQINANEYSCYDKGMIVATKPIKDPQQYGVNLGGALTLMPEIPIVITDMDSEKLGNALLYSKQNNPNVYAFDINGETIAKLEEFVQLIQKELNLSGDFSPNWNCFSRALFDNPALPQDSTFIFTITHADKLLDITSFNMLEFFYRIINANGATYIRQFYFILQSNDTKMLEQKLMEFNELIGEY